MTRAAALLDRLHASGVSVSLRPDGKLWLQPVTAITPELLAAVKAQRDDLVALLATCAPPRNSPDLQAGEHPSRPVSAFVPSPGPSGTTTQPLHEVEAHIVLWRPSDGHALLALWNSDSW